jgi:diadenosine tetraphosphate (Ap4A) HIT family hydrolase
MSHQQNINSFSEVPWKDVLIDTKEFTVFKDKFPVTEGHILFVPKVEDWDHLAKCYKAAYAWGYDWVQKGYCDSYNIGQNVGTEAGQTVMWPHVHLIPRRKGDMADPRGGVRGVIPEKQKYRYIDPKQPRLFVDLEGDCV